MSKVEELKKELNEKYLVKPNEGSTSQFEPFYHVPVKVVESLLEAVREEERQPKASIRDMVSESNVRYGENMNSLRKYSFIDGAKWYRELHTQSEVTGEYDE